MTLRSKNLSQREREVLQLIYQGGTNKTIAADLGISEHTVVTYSTIVLRKLNARTRSQAVGLAVEAGVVGRSVMRRA